MTDDPWRTQGEYRDEQKRLRRLYLIAYASVIIASMGAAGQWYSAVFAPTPRVVRVECAVPAK